MRRAAMPPGAYFYLIVSLRRSVATATRNDTLYPLSSCFAALAIHFPRRRKRKKYVILSVSEISHNLSEKYLPVSSSVGFFTPFRMTFILFVFASNAKQSPGRV